jgi:glycosyl hydrolase family 28
MIRLQIGIGPAMVEAPMVRRGSFLFVSILCLTWLAQTGCAQSPINVRACGALGDGKTKDTVAFQKALDRGGIVDVPAGNYVIGSILLSSKTTLRLAKDANLLGSPDLEDYPIDDVRWEGKWVRGHRGLIYAANAQHIAIEGPGHIAANPALGGRQQIRNPVLIEPVNCTHVRFEGFSTHHRGLWSIHPVYCQDLLAKNLTIRSERGNGDGIDIDSSQDVRVQNCDIQTGDDCIAIKSGRGMEGYKTAKPSANIVITGCTLADAGFACIGIGSEMSGGVKNVRIEHCKFLHAASQAIYIKSRPGRGGVIQNISAKDCDVNMPTAGFLRINLLNSGIQDEPVPGDEGIPLAKNLTFSDIRVNCRDLVQAFLVTPSKPIQNLTLENITGTCQHGMQLAYITNAALKDIHVTAADGPLLQIHDVTGMGLEGAVQFIPSTQSATRRMRPTTMMMTP